MPVSPGAGMIGAAVGAASALAAGVASRMTSSSSPSSTPTAASATSSSSSPPPKLQRATNPQIHRPSAWDGRTSPTPMFSSASNGRKYDDDRRGDLKKIAEQTLSAIKDGYYSFKGVDHQLKEKVQRAKKNTQFYGPDSAVTMWAATKGTGPVSHTHISVLNISTLDAARLLENVYKITPTAREKTGVLNFASATKPGGGFRNGAEAQEESIARASTLYPTLADTEQAKHFYHLHTLENAQNSLAYYSHAIVFSPGVTVFRDDAGAWTYPFDVDVLSCAAVNAGEVRKATHAPINTGLEVGIEKEMTERMGRILYVFEQQGVRNLVLGTFGTGVFRNNVAIVARIWAHLLIVQDARFKDSFDRIIFAITGEETFAEFQSAFDAWGKQRAAGHGRNQIWGQPSAGDLISL